MPKPEKPKALSPFQYQDIKAALQEQEEIFASVIEFSPIGKLLVDEKGKIALVNREIERLFGYSREELLGQSVEILIPEDLRKRHVEYRAGYTKNPSPRMMGAGRDLAGRKKDGSKILIEVGLNPLKIRSKPYVLAAIMDVTQRKNLEKKTAAAEHLAAIGKLASHIAHEIRNPLSSISLNLDMLQEEFHRLAAKPELKEADSLLQAIKTEIGRLSDLAGDYLHFSRLSKHETKMTDLQDFFANIELLLGAEARSRKIRISFPSEQAAVLFDPRQMQQVFINLIKNAMEAMPKGGKIEIKVKHDKEKTLFSILDEGHGMDEETKKDLFKPFFTTKEKGTGLGLSLVEQIVNEHQGQIWVQSKKGEGSAFYILLPSSMGTDFRIHDSAH